MKKFLSACLVVLFMFSISTSALGATSEEKPKGCTFTKSKDAKVLFKKEPTSNIDDLYKMAIEKKGFLKDDELKKFSKKEAYLESKEKGKNAKVDKVKLNIASTSELIEVYEDNGEKHEVFSVTEFALVSNKDLAETDSDYGVLGSETDYGEKWDSSISVKAYSTNYYNRSSADGANSCIDLSSVTGGWTRSDSSVSIGTKTVNYGQTGTRCDYIGSVTQKSGNKYPSSNSYSYAVLSSWVPVTIEPTSTVVGQSSTAELTRNSSKWTLSLTNHVTN
ncbi:hypothetical protein [Cytobacillus sp. NCCP-133]|uniref:hypothetical protein n=1 Tax=Cytobacillus sp. NCCP-133 TaxID=766848 RepID=UPI0022324F21|nr:hypothetical protein [Cytobacillus sp. NCCP-133]GLB62104.1 hypothetical protein NCCP133_42330 [Cytobacillus sp. NCCP-133]